MPRKGKAKNLVQSKCHPDRPHMAHGLCTTCYASKRRLGLSPEKRELERRGVRGSHYRTLYGFSVEAYDDLLFWQGGKCAICHRPAEHQKRRLAVDHDHRTGKVRGLLCDYCNVSVGHLEKVGVENVYRVAEYLTSAAE